MNVPMNKVFTVLLIERFNTFYSVLKIYLVIDILDSYLDTNYSLSVYVCLCMRVCVCTCMHVCVCLCRCELTYMEARIWHQVSSSVTLH